jgi:hypothetical protein
MMGQTLLTRNDDGDYTPAHRSLLEFFVAYKFAAELGVLASDFTELAQSQSFLEKNAPSQDYTWSSYFQRIVDNKGKIKLISPMRNFIAESFSHLTTTLGMMPPDKAVLDLIKNMLIRDKDELKARLLVLLDDTRGKTVAEVGMTGGNIASVLVSSDHTLIKNQDLSGANLSHAYLVNGDLTRCNLKLADLSHVDFGHATLVDATLQESKLDNIRCHPECCVPEQSKKAWKRAWLTYAQERTGNHQTEREVSSVLARNHAMRAEKSQAALRTGQKRHKTTPAPEPPFWLVAFSSAMLSS